MQTTPELVALRTTAQARMLGISFCKRLPNSLIEVQITLSCTGKSSQFTAL
jgi:hypothetical protein